MAVELLKDADDFFLLGLGHVHHQADLALGGHRAFEHEDQVVHLLPLPRVGRRVWVGDEARRALEDVADDPQVVGPEGTAGFRDFDDRVGEFGRLDFGRTPTEFDGRGDAERGEPAGRNVYHFRGDALPLQVSRGLDRRAVRHSQDPADGLAAGLAEDEFGEFDGAFGRVVFDDPVVPGEAAVERAVGHVAGHFLGADERTVDFGVVDGGVVAAARKGELVARLAEEVPGGLLKASRGQAEFEYGRHQLSIFCFGTLIVCPNSEKIASRLNHRRPY